VTSNVEDRVTDDDLYARDRAQRGLSWNDLGCEEVFRHEIATVNGGIRLHYVINLIAAAPRTWTLVGPSRRDAVMGEPATGPPELTVGQLAARSGVAVAALCRKPRPRRSSGVVVLVIDAAESITASDDELSNRSGSVIGWGEWAKRSCGMQSLVLVSKKSAASRGVGLTAQADFWNPHLIRERPVRDGVTLRTTGQRGHRL
jgi:hypothetical protein